MKTDLIHLEDQSFIPTTDETKPPRPVLFNNCFDNSRCFGEQGNDGLDGVMLALMTKVLLITLVLGVNFDYDDNGSDDGNDRMMAMIMMEIQSLLFHRNGGNMTMVTMAMIIGMQRLGGLLDDNQTTTTSRIDNGKIGNNGNDNLECDDLEGRFLRSTTSVHSFIT